MATVYLPQLGETIVEATVVRWLKREGERVGLHEPLLEVETDKAIVEIPSPSAGTLARVVAPEGAKVPVGGELGVIEVAEGAPPAVAPLRPPPLVEVREPPRVTPSDEAPTISPAVRRLAQEHGLDLSQVRGTGLGGRVTREDVERHLAALPRAAAPPPPEAGEEEEVPLSRMRRAIAEHMVRSKRTAPHAWALVETDVTGLARLRERWKEELRRQGIDLTYLPFAIKAVVESLGEHPLLNAVWEGERLLRKRRVNLGIAVASEEGLLVPVLRGAEGKGILALARASQDLVQRARQGRLALEETMGGTFTLNNTGALGSIMSMPIIHQPQVAILTTEAAVWRPVVVDDAIAIRSIMNLGLSFDHRALDGALALQFLNAVKRRLGAWTPTSPID